MALKDVGARLIVEGLPQFKASMASADRELKDLSTNILSHSRAIGTAMTAVGVGIVAGFGFATKAAIDFETAFAGVRKTVDATEEEFGVLRQGLRDMTKEIPLTHSELARIAEAAGQLGIQKEGILGFTKVMSLLGLTTNLTGDEAATTFARFANITGMDPSFFANLGSVIVDLGNNMATTEGEIASLGLRLAGAGTIVGLTQSEILALAASLSSMGISAEAGGTAFSRVMLEMNTAVAGGGEILNIWASVAGMSADTFRKKFEEDAMGAILTFIDGLGNMRDAGTDVVPVLDELGLGGIRITDSLLRASGAQDLVREATELASIAWEENTALAEEATKRLETTKARMDILKNTLTDVGITIGDFIVPKLKELIDQLMPIIENVQRWIKENPILAGTILKIVGGVGALLLVLGPLLIMLPGLITAFGLLKNILLKTKIVMVALKNATIAQKVATIASTVATNLATAAMWLFNLSLGPLIILVAALTLGIGMLVFGIWGLISQANARRRQSEREADLEKLNTRLKVEHTKAIQGLDNSYVDLLKEAKELGFAIGEEAEAYLLASAAAELHQDILGEETESIDEETVAINEQIAALKELERAKLSQLGAAFLSAQEVGQTPEQLAEWRRLFSSINEESKRVRIALKETLDEMLIEKAVKEVLEGVERSHTEDLIRKTLGFIPSYQHGGISPGGLSVVGERGPELLSLPSGAAVSPINNTTNFNVEATYTNPQDPASIALDLEALTLAAGK